jgi:hypothetical protein
MAFSITTLSKRHSAEDTQQKTLSVMGLFVTLSINVFSVIMLRVVMLSVVAPLKGASLE